MTGRDLYAVLGLARDADADAIKQAFRGLAKEHHPDAGGDGDVFAEIETAYTVLSDPARRAEYDRTGQWTERNIASPEEQARQRLMALFGQILAPGQRIDRNVDLKALMLRALDEQSTGVGNMLAAAREHRAAVENVVGRLPRKDKEESMFDRSARQMLDQIDARIGQFEGELEGVKAARAVLEEYDSVFEAVQQVGFSRGSTTSSLFGRGF